MNRFEIPDRSRFIEIASCWDELEQKQVIKLLKLTEQLNNGIINYDNFIVMAFYVIAKVQRDWLSVCREKMLSKAKRELKFANTYQVAEQLTSFLFLDVSDDEKNNDVEKTVEINYGTVHNFFPTIKTNLLSFLGPADLLTDLTFGEFKMGLDAMHQFFQSKAEEDLNHLIACLYRPAQERSAIKKREIFNEELYDIYAQKLNAVPRYIKMGILLWFANCIKYIQKEDLTINGRTINLAVLFPTPKKGAKASGGLGWTGILYSIAKEGVFGDTDKVESKGLFDVLLFMYDNHLQNERIKRNAKK